MNFIDLPQGWFSQNDVKTYRDLFSSLPQNAWVCELGSWKGRSLCSVADIIIEKNIKVFSVDTWKGAENDMSTYQDAITQDLKVVFQSNLAKFGIDSYVTCIQEYTDNAVDQLKQADYKFDLIFIDADHSTEAVLKDIKNYYPLLRTNKSIISGHDFKTESVNIAIVKSDLEDVRFSGNIWWCGGDLKATIDSSITAVICTKDRYDYLYDTILCILNQSRQPEYLKIFDDSDDKVDLSQSVKWMGLFSLLDKSQIHWSFIHTDKHGQNKNHQLSIETSTTEYIWRVDDDLIFDSNILERLLRRINKDPMIGAVAPKVLMLDNNILFSNTSSMIKDVYDKPNIQLSKDGLGLHSVEHLHCTFIYRRDTGTKYHEGLSRVGHREETIFSYRLFKNNYELLVDLDIEVFHLKANHGGIRSKGFNNEMFMSDEKLFSQELIQLQTELTTSNNLFVMLDNGIGDHFMFKNILPNLLSRYDFVTISCCFPHVFWESGNYNLISIAEGQSYLRRINKSPDDYNIYRFMDLNRQYTHILDGFKAMYQISSEHRLVVDTNDEHVAIIIPMFNAEQFIYATINSILSQTHQFFDIYIIDDKSTDNSRKILELIDDARINILDAPNKVGYPGPVRNIGLEHIKDMNYDFIAFCDSDDLWHENHLSESMIYAIQNNFDMVYSDCIFKHENGTPLTPFGIAYYEQFDRDRLLQGNFIYISSVVCKSKCFKDLRFDKSLKNLEDHDMWLRISNEFNVGHLINNLTTYTVKEKETYYSQEESNSMLPVVLEKNRKIKYSIVIGTYNHLEDCLKPCLESIYKYTNLWDVEIIVVANGCTDGTIDYIKSLSSVVRLIEHRDALGFSKAYNLGIKAARGEYIILLNNDTVLLEQPHNEWINKLEQPFRVNEVVGLTGPLKLWSDVVKQEFLVFFCVMIHRDVIAEVGLLNEKFEVGSSEDIAYCVEANLHGYTFEQVPTNTSLNASQNYMIGNFPIWHKGEVTMHEIPNWENIFQKNLTILKQEYSR